MLGEAREWVAQNIVGKTVAIEPVEGETKTDGVIESTPNYPPLSLLDVEATQYFFRTAPTEEEGGGGPGEGVPST